MGRREQILEAAFDIVGRDGLEGLHARTVASKLGINHAAVHYYYRTRKDLLMALANYVFERFEQARATYTDAAVGANDRNLALVRQAESYGQSGEHFIDNWASFFVASIDDPDMRALLATHLEKWQAAFELDASDRLLQNPRILVSLLIGLLLVSRIQGSDTLAQDMESIGQSLEE